MFWSRRRTDDLTLKAEPVATLAAPDDALLELLGVISTAAGKPVSAETAMRVPAVSCAVRTLAETIGQLPVHVYRESADGGRERDRSHPAYALVHDDATEWTSAAQLRTQVTTDALLHGDGFAYVGRAQGRPVEIYRLKPGSVTISESETDGGPVYTVNEGRGARVLARRDVIHIPAFSIDGLRGRAPIKLARESIAVLDVMAEHASRLFGRGARPAGAIEIPVKVDDATLKRMRASWQGYEGSGNAGRTPVFEMGAKFTPFAFNSVDAQFLEIWTFHIQEIARAFRVPPHMLFDLGRATWSNIEDLGRDFLTYSLLPWLKTWEAAYRRTLIAPEDRPSVHAEFLVDDLLRADLASRADAYAKLIAARVLNPNEARAMENRPPYEGGATFENPNTTSAPAGATEDA